MIVNSKEENSQEFCLDFVQDFGLCTLQPIVKHLSMFELLVPKGFVPCTVFIFVCFICKIVPADVHPCSGIREAGLGMASVPGGDLAASLAGAPVGEQGPSWQPHEVLRQHIQVLNSEHASVPLGDLGAHLLKLIQRRPTT